MSLSEATSRSSSLKDTDLQKLGESVGFEFEAGMVKITAQETKGELGVDK